MKRRVNVVNPLLSQDSPQNPSPNCLQSRHSRSEAGESWWKHVSTHAQVSLSGGNWFGGLRGHSEVLRRLNSWLKAGWGGKIRLLGRTFWYSHYMHLPIRPLAGNDTHCKKKSGNFSGLEPDCTVHSGWVRISILRITVQKYLEIDPRRGIVSS